jgi:glycosyltransferase involved in cell wall biosynthesis
MKVLIYSHAFAPKIGGVETYVMLLAKRLAQGNQQKVTVLTSTAADGMDDALLPFPVVRQPGLVTLLRLLWEADVVHVAGPCFLPMLFGLMLRKPVLVEHSGYQSACPNGLLLYEPTKTVCPGHFLAHRYYQCVRCNTSSAGLRKSLSMLLLTFPRRWLCRNVARNVGPSAHVGRRVDLPRTVTIHHGVPIPPDVEQSGHEQQLQPVCFAYIGRLVWEKGVPVLLGAAREVTTRGCEFRLKIIGDGPDRPRLEQMTESYGLRHRTVFAGYLQGKALEDAVAGAVSVMPSVWEDVAPVAAIEHLMQGRLLIASEIGGLGELVDGTGLKFAPGDVQGLASCMQRVVENPNLVKVLGEKARERAQQLFREDRMAAEHLSVYGELVRNAGLLPAYVGDKG